MRAKVLYFLASTVWGGVEEHVLSLIKVLDRKRFSVMLVCPPALLEVFQDHLAGIPVESFPLHVASPTRLDHWLNALRFYRLLRRTRPDIVNCHLLRSTALGAPLAKLAGVPVVIATNHGPEPWRRGPIKGWYALDRYVDRFITRTIAVCQSARDDLVLTKRMDPRKIVVINNGREMENYTPLSGDEIRRVRDELGLVPGERVIGAVGRLDHQKGHRYLLGAMPEVLRWHPNARLVLVGDGALLGDLQGQAEALGISGRVLFTGFRADIRRMLGIMDVVALPSLWEGLPLTVIEALAMAKPVVASGVNGVLDLISDGSSGLLVPPGDSAALAKAIDQLLKNPLWAAELGAEGRGRVLVAFDIRRQVERTATIYEECLAARSWGGHP